MTGARHFAKERERKSRASLKEARERHRAEAVAPPSSPQLGTSPGERTDLSGQIGGANTERLSSEKNVPTHNPAPIPPPSSPSGSAVGSSVADEIQRDCSVGSPRAGLGDAYARARTLLADALDAHARIRAFIDDELGRYRAKQARNEPLTRAESRALNRALYSAQYLTNLARTLLKKEQPLRRIRGVRVWQPSSDATEIAGAAESGSSNRP
jgi:hypothetical protein